MLTKDDLKTLLDHTFDLTDAQVDKLLAETTLREVADNEILFNQGDPADNFYLLKDGKVILEANLGPGVTASLASVKPAYVFGLSSLLAGVSHEMRARAVEPSEVVVFDGEGLRALMDKDTDLGYRIMKAMYGLLKSRLDNRTGQFLKLLGRHPDLRLGAD
jgi:CRP/FNR family cyclic AMP-dependent transcriptional regulator